MAGLTDAGSLVFRIKAETDKNSFEEGKKQIDNTSESMNKLIGTARNAAVALVSIKTIGKLGTFADAESSAYKTSKALGITTESLKTWKAAAKIAGVDANSLVNSMGQLGSVISHIKIDGRGLDEYSKKLQEIGLGITDLKDKEGNWLSADKAFQKVIAKGQEEYAKAKTEEGTALPGAANTAWTPTSPSPSKASAFWSGDRKTSSVPSPPPTVLPCSCMKATVP